MLRCVNWIKQRHILVTIFYCYSYIVLGSMIASLGPALPEIANRTNVSLQEGGIGALTTSRSVGYLLGSIASGVQMEKRPLWGNVVIACALMLTGFGTAAMTLLSNFIMVCFTLMTTGFAMGILDVAANVLILREFVTPEEAGPYMQALHASFALGTTVTPAFVTKLMVLNGGSYNVPFWILAICTLPGVVGGLIVAFRVKHTNASSATPPAEYQGGLSKVRRYIFVALCAVILGLYVGAEVATGVYVYTFARFVSLFSELSAGLVNTLFWFSFLVGRILGIFLAAARVSPRLMMWGSLLSACAFSVLMVFFPHVEWMVWMACAGVGISMAPTYPTVFGFASLYINVSGAIASIFSISSALGEMLIPLLIGALFSVPSIGFQSLFPVVAICAFLGLLLAFILLFVVRGVDSSTTTTFSNSHGGLLNRSLPTDNEFQSDLENDAELDDL